MSGLPVTGVTAGLNTSYGFPTVENVTDSFAPIGWESSRVSFQHFIYFDGQTGFGVNFSFEYPYGAPLPQNVPFVFGGYLNSTGQTAGDQSAIGYPRIGNAARVVEPPGWESPYVSRIVRFTDGDRDVDFLFDTTYIEQTPLNTPFYFGGEVVVTAVTLGDQSAIGLIPSIVKPPEINPPSIASTLVAGKPRVSDGPNVDFYFTATYDAPTTLNAPFYFGTGNLTLSAGAIDSAFVPTPRVVNSARQLLASGIPPGDESFIRPLVYSANEEGVGVNFSFVQDYSGQTPLNAPFYFAGVIAVNPAGVDSAEYGTLTATLFVRYVEPPSLEPQIEFGGAYVVNDIEFAVDLTGQGIYQFAAGVPDVFEGERIIDVLGIIPGEVGQHELTVPPETQTVRGEGLDATLWGDAFIASTIRYITLNAGFNSTAYGSATVGYRVRYVFPESTYYVTSFQQFGRPIAWEGTRYVSPLGEETLEFGVTDARRNEFFVLPPSIVGEMGEVDVQYGRRFVEPREFLEAYAAGAPTVFNSRQYVTQIFTTENVPYLGGFGPYTWVYNANRTVAPFSWVSSRYSSGTFVYNNARLVEAQGSETTLWGDTLVADAVRYVSVEGFDEFLSRPWTVVYNLARILEPSGIPRQFPGIPYVWSNTQWVDLYGSDNEHLEWGTHLVAPAVRYITFVRQNGIENFSIGSTNAFGATYTGLFTRYVEPPYINTSRVGDHFFEEKFTIFKPWGISFTEYGEALVKNATPQLFLIGPEPPLVPKPLIGFDQTVDVTSRSIVPTWPVFPPWGTLVEYRTKRLLIPSIDSLRIPQHNVQLDAPQLPATQFVDAGGFNYDPQYSKLGFPTVRRHPVIEGWVSSRYGTAWVRVQGCRPRWDFPSSEFGFGTPMLNPPEEVATGVGLGWLEAHGKPRITPHTIYCTADPSQITQQAQLNHPNSGWEPIDSNGRSPDVLWGSARVWKTGDQFVDQFHDYYSSATGERFSLYNSVENKIRRIFPDSISRGPFGFPELPTTAELFLAGIDYLEFGDTVVSRGQLLPFTITLGVPGLNAFAAGTQFIELFNREAPMQGFVATLFGNNSPMVYHYPRGTTNTGGQDITIWGTPWVDFSTRYVTPTGYESFTMDYDLLYFNDRLKVRKLNHPVYPTGPVWTEFGTAGARLATQFVAPYMIPPPRCLGHDVFVTLN